MKIQKHAIPVHLKAAVHSIWMVEDEVTREAVQQVRAFPHGYVYINVNAEKKLTIRHGILREEVETKCYLCGQTMRPSILDIPNVHRSLVIRFHPWVIPALFGISSAEVADKYIPLRLMDADFSDQLEELVEGRFSFDEITSKIEKMIESRFSIEQLDRRLLYICNILVQQKGAVDLQSMSDTFDLSNRRIQQLFRDYIGISPKKFCRIARFNDYTYQVLTNREYIHLYDHYFDQSHFSNEIKKLSGLTPGTLENLLNNFYARQAYLQTNMYYVP